MSHELTGDCFAGACEICNPPSQYLENIHDAAVSKNCGRCRELESQLAEQLEYIAHKPYCKWYDTSVNAVERVLHCDCGLQAILNREKQDAGT